MMMICVCFAHLEHTGASVQSLAFNSAWAKPLRFSLPYHYCESESYIFIFNLFQLFYRQSCWELFNQSTPKKALNENGGKKNLKKREQRTMNNFESVQFQNENEYKLWSAVIQSSVVEVKRSITTLVNAKVEESLNNKDSSCTLRSTFLKTLRENLTEMEQKSTTIISTLFTQFSSFNCDLGPKTMFSAFCNLDEVKLDDFENLSDHDELCAAAKVHTLHLQL